MFDKMFFYDLQNDQFWETVVRMIMLFLLYLHLKTKLTNTDLLMMRDGHSFLLKRNVSYVL